MAVIAASGGSTQVWAKGNEYFWSADVSDFKNLSLSCFAIFPVFFGGGLYCGGIEHDSDTNSQWNWSKSVCNTHLCELIVEDWIL